MGTFFFSSPSSPLGALAKKKSSEEECERKNEKKRGETKKKTNEKNMKKTRLTQSEHGGDELVRLPKPFRLQRRRLDRDEARPGL